MNAAPIWEIFDRCKIIEQGVNKKDVQNYSMNQRFILSRHIVRIFFFGGHPQLLSRSSDACGKIVRFRWLHKISQQAHFCDPKLMNCIFFDCKM